MKKKELTLLQWLKATDEMLAYAKADIPVLEERHGRMRYIYKYNLYIMASVEDRYLKVALFIPDHLSLGGTDPMYSLFIDKEDEAFIGYDHLLGKWTTAMLNRLKTPYELCYSKIFCTSKDTACICKYLETDASPYDAISNFQSELRRKNVLRRHKKLTDQWDQVMQKVPRLPNDWEHWIKKEGLTENFIFYEYTRRGATQGYCTWCEKEVPIVRPKHNQIGTCSCCHQKITFKSAGKAKRVTTKQDTAYLIQPQDTAFVVREFVIKMLVKTSSYQKPMFQWAERRRFVYANLSDYEEYYYGYDKTTGHNRWIKGDLTTTWGCGWKAYIECVRGKLYRANLLELDAGILRYSGLRQYAEYVSFVNPCEYVKYVNKHPELEPIVKAGLRELAKEMVNTNKEIHFTAAKDLGRALLIDRNRMNRLRQKNGGFLYLDWLRYEKKQNTVISDQVIDWMHEQGIKPTELLFIQNYMSAEQVKNYLVRQSAESGESVKGLVTIWEDYLIMAQRMGIDIADPIIYRTRTLVQRHNELAQQLGDKNTVEQAKEIEQKYPNLPQICSELKKYEYSNGKYQILAPQRVEDILLEGRKLLHCIHKNELYFDRMSSRESFILFLRKSEEASVPYYTLEIEPNGTVRQKRTLYNRQLPDIEKAEKFLVKWQKQLQKKLKKEDFELAKRSKELRIKEMDELRINQVRLNGIFDGRLLADVLAEDLMEAA